MALSERALTTVAACETEFGLASGAEARLEGWIEDASEMIVGYLDRALHRGSAIVEQHAGDGNSWLLLARPPIISIASVARAGTALDTTAYEVDNAAAGSVLFIGGLVNDADIALPGVAGGFLPGTERRRYVVTYAGGYITPGQAAVGGTFAGQTVTLPRAFSRACIELVAHIRARKGSDQAVTSEGMLGYSVSYASPDADGSGIPAPIRAKLDPYRFVAMG